MFILLLAIGLVAFIFFGLIPGLGAFLIRGHWHRFRQLLIEVSLWPTAGPEQLAQSLTDHALGQYRFWGRLDSIQGEDRLWLRNEYLTVGLEMKKGGLYLLEKQPTYQGGTKDQETEGIYAAEEPVYLSWKNVYSLPSGLKAFVAGPLLSEAGQLIFKRQARLEPLVILFDGEPQELLKSCIWSARQRNEYVNQFTPVSLSLGSLLLLFISFLLFQQVSNLASLFIPALTALSLSTFPLIYLLPPGVLFYFIYRFFWKRSRLLRAERDLIRLPLRYFQPNFTGADYQEVMLPNGERYVAWRWSPDKGEPPFRLPEKITVRRSSLLSPGSRHSFFYFFGIQDEQGLKPSSDPMVELVSIPGNPLVLAEECNRKAKQLSLVSAFCFFIGLILNLGLLFTGLYFLLV